MVTMAMVKVLLLLTVQCAVSYRDTLHKLLEARDLERPSSADSLIDKLPAWLRSHGGTVSQALEVGQFNGVRGVSVTQSVKKGTVLVKVPSDLIMYGDPSILDDDADTAIGDDAQQTETFTSKLIETRRSGKHSGKDLDLYLKTLPTLESLKESHPLFLDEANAKRYKFLDIVNWVGEKNQAIERSGCIQKFSDDECRWAYAVRMSRVFGMQRNGQRSFALVPMADLFNTGPDEAVNCNWKWSADGKSFEVTAGKDLSAGEQVVDSYQISSKKSNEVLAYYFGLTLPRNPTQIADARVNKQACLEHKQSSLQQHKQAASNSKQGYLQSLLQKVADEACHKF